MIHGKWFFQKQFQGFGLSKCQGTQQFSDLPSSRSQFFSTEGISQMFWNTHPGRLTAGTYKSPILLDRKMIFQTSMIMFHVNLPGCKSSIQIWNKSGPKSARWFLPWLLLNSAPPNSDWLLEGLRQRATGSGLPPGSNNKGWPSLRNVRGRIPLQWYQYQYKCQPNVFTHCWLMFWNATPTPICCSTWNSSKKLTKTTQRGLEGTVESVLKLWMQYILRAWQRKWN